MKKRNRTPTSKRRPAHGLLFAILLLPLASSLVSTSDVRPAGLSEAFEAIPLGRVHVTKYTHHETRSRLTSSGYLLTDQDEGRVCAISRDWWRSRIKPGDLIWVEGQKQPCMALDTMAVRNRKGMKQLRWVDIYITDRQTGLDFGIQKAVAYLIRPS